MCGICGVIAPDPGDVERVVQEQLSLLDHRGPDARGSFAARAGRIAQNRLSIIDLVHGDPPITNEDSSVAAVLNGEIYNFRRLREELERDGHRFGSNGDTEVIAHLAEQLEPVELCRRLDGMFAFAVWDERRNRLVIGRDRLGKKPLYYWAAGDRFVFASELKGLFADPAVPRRLDPGAIPAYLTFGYVPTPRTFFDGVRSLPPGHVLSLDPGGDPRIERYWSPPVAGVNGAPRLAISLDDAAAQVRSRLEAAVERRLVADVPLGAFLSGGIDSAAVVGIMAGLVDQPVQTFTIGFDDRDGFDERPYARLAATRHSTEHHEFIVQPQAVDLVERLVWHNDQPFADPSAVPTYLLSELTRRHVTVALSGDGGDELFAGYERFAAALAANRYAALPAVVQGAAAAGLRRLPRSARAQKLRRFAGVAGEGLPGAYLDWVSYVKARDREALLDRQQDDWALRDYEAIWRASEGARTLDRLLDLNLRTYLLDDLLVKVDRTSMAHALEVRSPFLDTHLLELAGSLPPKLKARGLSLKRVLKAAVADIVPEEIVERPKRGFGVPLDRWFREDLHSYVAGTLGARDARVKEHLAAGAVDRLIAEHDTRSHDHGYALWTLLVLEIFLRREGW
jgi:asparagine synthase (glutamine-hydrolysing)